ncbi:Cdc15p [Rhizophagus irregularis DAOM 197198w]|uniref:Cdc15p n=4 Tax=Rhizophagus irregularis TaxID=588596 RepID=A0A015IUM5_RHIIW|nr:Cdc15p [Rhizophagus irregularis DAOM 197198w]
MEGFVKELCRFASIQNITISLIRLMLRPFEMCFTFIYRFGILVLLYIVLEEHVFHSCLTSIRPYWFKLKLSLSLQFTICLNCGRFLTGLYWCQNCGKKYFTDNFSKWTSGNDYIDELIRDTQKNAMDTTDYIEWIPYSELEIMKQIGEGGFGTVYFTIWKGGGPLTMIRRKIERLWQFEEKYNRESGHLDEEVSNNLRQHYAAIKILKNSDTNTMEKFLKELKAYIKCVTTLHLQKVMVRCYGISREPTMGKYIFVMELKTNGNLRQYLKKNFSVLKWYDDKLKILANLSSGLKAIHEAELVHRDLHAGNILIGHDKNAHITDLGLCCLENEQKSKFSYGVLPFIAPEVLRNHKYTFASDIYSFGIIMWMLTTGQLPFANYEYDQLLEIEICKGKKPRNS